MIVFVLNVRHNIAKNMFVVVLVAKIGIFFVKNKCYSFFYLTCDDNGLCLKKILQIGKKIIEKMFIFRFYLYL